MLQRFNLPALVASFLALILYLTTPVIRLAYVLGVNGMMCARLLGFVFILPLILLIIVMILSLFPMNHVSSIASFITALYLLIMLIFIPQAVTGPLANLIAMGSASGALGSSGILDIAGSLLGVGSALVVRAAWGFYLVLILCIAGAVGGLLLSTMAQSSKDTRRSAPTVARPSNNNGLYR